MPNILNRPMFRRGGSAAEGTGITSGLTNRRAHYDDGATQAGTQQSDLLGNTDQYINPVLNAANYNPNSGISYDQYLLNSQPGGLASNLNVPPNVLHNTFQDIKNQILPSTKQSLSNALGAFGASGADVPAGAKQTWGQAFGKMAQTLEAETQKNLQEANKYGAEGEIAQLKGINAAQKQAYDQKAWQIARNPNFMPGKSLQEKHDAAEIALYNKGVYTPSPYTKIENPQNVFNKDMKDYLDTTKNPQNFNPSNPGSTPTQAEAKNFAIYKQNINNGNISNIQGIINSSKYNKDFIITQNAPQYKTNDVYYDVSSNQFYKVTELPSGVKKFQFINNPEGWQYNYYNTKTTTKNKTQSSSGNTEPQQQ